jgi:HK97 family phage prohead protease
MNLLILRQRNHQPAGIRLVRTLSAAVVHARNVPAPATQVDPVDEQFGRLKRWEAGVELEAPDLKKVTMIKDPAGNVIDYRGVTIEGYLSTFKATTESDRQGDYVEPGAFTETLKKFAQNPVMLVDHRNSVAFLGGKFVEAKEDKRGLFVRGILSDAPGNVDLRFKVVEGMLKTLSMGGLFHYKEDGRGIFKVDLWEGSLTPIPANPDARFSVRALTDSEKHFVKTAHLWPSYYHFLEALGARNLAGVTA